MHTKEELLFIYGFVNDGELKRLSIKEREKRLEDADKDGKKELLKKLDQETLEVADGYFDTTDYPASNGHLRLVYESPSNSVEGAYFWILEHLRQDRGFPEIIKITDVYSATEASAFWGNQQQRISAQQNQAQGFLRNIGEFTKQLFQMVRELRIIDERLEAYEQWRESPSADVTLKSIFTDVVEGGTKNPQSVFGLAQTVGFTILPDLFFNTKVYEVDDLDKRIDAMDYNTQVKNVLRRKLYQFIKWKENTHEELKSRRKFNINYLRQHWAIIEMYMSWVKPYLRNVERLQMKQTKDDPELVSSFDQSWMEVEILAKGPNAGGGAHPVVLVNFTFRTRPDMSIRKEYQQGPGHMGRLDINFRAYGWTEKEIERYKQMRAREELELLGLLDSNLASLMEELGDDFRKYIGLQEEKVEEPEKEEKKSAAKKTKQELSKTFEPFIALGSGFKTILSPFTPSISVGGKKKKKGGTSPNYGKAAGSANGAMFLTWHIYKKSQRMLTW